MKHSAQTIPSAVFFTILALGFISSANAQQTPQDEVKPPQVEEMFDTDRNMLLKDSDGDETPDLTESLTETDPLDPTSFPGSDTLELEQRVAEEIEQAEVAGFPAANCRTGYRQAGPRLCISTSLQSAARYHWAQRRCRVQRGRVASYEDLYYLYIHSSLDSSYNPSGRWIGNMVADDNALCGNSSITFDGDPDIQNFEGTCNKNDNRSYWCAHDRF